MPPAVVVDQAVEEPAALAVEESVHMAIAAGATTCPQSSWGQPPAEQEDPTPNQPADLPPAKEPAVEEVHPEQAAVPAASQEELADALEKEEAPADAQVDAEAEAEAEAVAVAEAEAELVVAAGAEAEPEAAMEKAEAEAEAEATAEADAEHTR